MTTCQAQGFSSGADQSPIITLDYADDAALLDVDAEVASKRVSSIAKGSREDADMIINITKTEAMHVKEQGRVSATTKEKAKGVCKHVCPHMDCNKVFLQCAWVQSARRKMQNARRTPREQNSRCDM